MKGFDKIEVFSSGEEQWQNWSWKIRTAVSGMNEDFAEMLTTAEADGIESFGEVFREATFVDATTLHNGIRDVYFDFCEQAGLRPISEAPNILLDVFTLDGRCRPADILCIPALALARVLPNGARAVRTEPVCMDIAVINALGQDHWRHTAVRAGSSADVYSTAKATRNDISKKCWAAGYRFWPIVHEFQGGMAKGADAAMRAICAAVEEKENTDAMTVRVEFLGRLAAVTTRAATRAVQKRTTKKRTGTAPDLPAMTVRQVMRAVEPEIDREEELEVEGL